MADSYGDLQRAAGLALVESLRPQEIILQGLSPALLDVAAERQRQVRAEGWSAEHDDAAHDDGDLAVAAAAYTMNACDQLSPYSQGDGDNEMPDFWPWEASWWKPTTPRRDLVKAAALILAEIDRLDRAAAAAPAPAPGEDREDDADWSA